MTTGIGAATCRRMDAKGKACGGEIEDGVCGKCGRPEQKGSLVSGLAPAGPTAPAAREGTGTTGVARTGSGRVSRRHSGAAGTSRRQALGGGLVSLPPVPSQDPLALVMPNPEVAPNKRTCPEGHRVNKESGFCPQCGEPYDFRPRLKAGDVVAGKYEIKGPIGLGGMGWIYLGADLVLKRWVVLKGVLNAKDPEAAAAAVAERQFLAAVKDPKIVSIYDFVAQGADGYMVLEYVGGRTVDQIRADNDVVDLLDDDGKAVRKGVLRKDIAPDEARYVAQVTRFGTLPPEQAISYVLAICSAFTYLHSQGFTHNDMKPDNVMVEGDAVKLLDLGAMRRIGDQGGSIFGTDGFFAPEASEDPIAVSDLYSLGRSLAVLLMDFLYKVRADRDQGTGRVTTRRLIVTGFKTALPAPDQQPVLAQNDSLYRFLTRATHEDPDQRFQSAEEMEGQLYGILREIVALKSGPRPAESKVFFNDGLVDGSDLEGASRPLARTLPLLRLDPGDVAAQEIMSLSTVVDLDKRAQALSAIGAKAGKKAASVEAKLRLADTYLAMAQAPLPAPAHGNPTEASAFRKEKLDGAVAVCDGLLKDNEFEWRAHWYLGKVRMEMGDATKARDHFDRVYFEMPGELAPKLAMAYAAEALGDLRNAGRLYGLVATVDPSYASAGFGLARCLGKAGDSPGAAKALADVPPSSSMYTEARMALVRVLVDADHRANAGFIERAGVTVAAISTDKGSLHGLRAYLFAAVVALLRDGAMKEDPSVKLLERPLTLRSMQFAAEREFVGAGRYSSTANEKAMWVDRAHAVRPVTLL